MAQVFANPGQSAEDGITYPDLFSDYVAAIDDPNAVDGLGVVTPWGGGATARTTGTEGLLSAVGQSSSGLSLTSGGGNAVTYNIEGLVGPQGPQGPPGEPGSITTIQQQVFVPVGTPDLDTVLQQIRDVWSGDVEDIAGTMLYTEEEFAGWKWDRMNIAPGVATWRDSAVNADGSFMLLAANYGICVSANGGEAWMIKNPSDPDERFVSVSVADNTGKAVALGANSRRQGKIWTSIDSGTSWTEVFLGLP